MVATTGRFQRAGDGKVRACSTIMVILSATVCDKSLQVVTVVFVVTGVLTLMITEPFVREV